MVSVVSFMVGVGGVRYIHSDLIAFVRPEFGHYLRLSQRIDLKVCGFAVSTFTSSLFVLTTNSLERGMRRRQFILSLGAAAAGSAIAAKNVAASGPITPSYVFLQDSGNEEVLNEFSREEVDEHEGDSWGWTLTRYAHEEIGEVSAKRLDFDVPPYALYVYHLNAGRRLDLEPATEIEEKCVGVSAIGEVASVNVDCVTTTKLFSSEPDPTEVGSKGEKLFQDQIEGDLPISSSKWEFGLKKSGFFRDSDWDYTESGTTPLDERTYTGVVKDDEREQIDNAVAGFNDLEVRGFLTTEQASGNGHYLVLVGVVPDSDSVDMDGVFTDPVKFDPASSRKKIRKLMKAASA